MLDYSTYYMFTMKEDGTPDKTVGPFFLADKQKIKNKCFDNHLSLEERAIYLSPAYVFQSRYPITYIEHMQTAWLDKVYCYILANAWIGKANISVQTQCCTSNWFTLMLIDMGEYSDPCLEVSLSVNCNPFYAAKLMEDLHALKLSFEIIKGPEFYIDKTRNIVIENPLSLYLADKMNDEACLS